MSGRDFSEGSNKGQDKSESRFGEQNQEKQSQEKQAQEKMNLNSSDVLGSAPRRADVQQGGRFEHIPSNKKILMVGQISKDMLNSIRKEFAYINNFYSTFANGKVPETIFAPSANAMDFSVALPNQTFKGSEKIETLYAIFPPKTARNVEGYVAFDLRSDNPDRDRELQEEPRTLANCITYHELVFRMKTNDLIPRRDMKINQKVESKYTGEYRMKSGQQQGTLWIKEVSDTELRFSIDSLWLGDANTGLVQTGSRAGALKLNNDLATYQDGTGLSLQFKFSSERCVIWCQKLVNYGGDKVDPSGNYARVNQKSPTSKQLKLES